MEDNWLYFLDNEEWYRYDYKKGEYYLTDKAPKKAQESYNEYIKWKSKKKNGEPYMT